MRRRKHSHKMIWVLPVIVDISVDGRLGINAQNNRGEFCARYFTPHNPSKQRCHSGPLTGIVSNPNNTSMHKLPKHMMSTLNQAMSIMGPSSLKLRDGKLSNNSQRSLNIKRLGLSKLTRKVINGLVVRPA